MIVALALLVWSCGYNDFDDLKAEHPEPPVISMTISDLKSLYEIGGTTISENIVICGQVISSDSAGNFYKTLMIEDNTSGIELKIGLFDLYASYPEGSVMYVKVKGLTIGRHYDGYVLGIGTPSGSFYETDFLGTPAIVEKFVTTENMPGPLPPSEISIPQIDNSLLCSLITIRDVRFLTPTGTFSGERTLRDRIGNRIKIYTSPYATFANENLPATEFSITGVLLKYKDNYQIVIRDLNDISVD